MRLPDFVRREGGVVHRSILRNAGFSRSAIRAHLEAHSLIAVRRDWIAVPDSSDLRRTAVAHGARLTCASAAKDHGLWVRDLDRVHLGFDRGGHHRPTAAAAAARGQPVLHWQLSLVPVPRHAVVDPLPNALAAVAKCLPFEEAVAVFDSALNLRRISEPQLEQMTRRCGPRFSEVVAAADGRADSGIESLPRVRLARIGISMRLQVMLNGHRVDGLVGRRLVLQFDGDGYHSSRADRERDRREDAGLVLIGYTVLRYGYEAVCSDWPMVEAEIRAAIAQGLHL